SISLGGGSLGLFGGATTTGLATAEMMGPGEDAPAKKPNLTPSTTASTSPTSELLAPAMHSGNPAPCFRAAQASPPIPKSKPTVPATMAIQPTGPPTRGSQNVGRARTPRIKPTAPTMRGPIAPETTGKALGKA